MKNFVLSCAAVLAIVAVVIAAAPVIMPDGFELRLVATDLSQPKGIESTPHGIGMGSAGHDLFVVESGMNRILRIDPETGDVEIMAETSVEFPVGIRAHGGPHGQLFYIGGAYAGGIECADLDGVCEPFALEDLAMAGMDIGRGPFGNDLYAGEWNAGNIWRIDFEGNATLFTTLPDAQARYMKFSNGGSFGNYLYVTDYSTGDIYRVDPSGTATFFATTGSNCLEGLDFSKGGAFGRFLYTGDLCTGELFRVAPDGTVETFASGFEGVADIKFVPGPMGGVTMFLVDGHSSVFEIRFVK